LIFDRNMETTFRLRADELDNNFISAIQQLFKQKTIEINIHDVSSFGLNEPETPAQYLQRLQKAIENVSNGKLVSMSTPEFEELTNKLNEM
jgi:hypothetical protein